MSAPETLDQAQRDGWGEPTSDDEHEAQLNTRPLASGVHLLANSGSAASTASRSIHRSEPHG
jgi:hypothetical protein